MIRSLRARHRAIFVVLAALVPAGYAAALLGRRAAPPTSAWPEATVTPAASGDERLVTWSPISLRTRIRRADDGTLAVALESWREPAPPDALVYWSASEPGDGELPDDARLLGPLGNGPRALSLEHAPEGGWLVLFSLGHGEVVASLALAEER